MENRKISVWKFTPEFFLVLFLAAFGVGVVGANLFWEPYLQQGNVLGIYMLFQLSKEELSTKEYFFYILKYRGGWLFMCLLGSFSVWGLPLAILTVLILGLFLGGILALAVLQFGVSGMAGGAALFLPQGLCYLPATIFLMGELARKSASHLRFQGKVKKISQNPLLVEALCLGGYILGILLESYVNPIFLNFVLEKIKIF